MPPRTSSKERSRRSADQLGGSCKKGKRQGLSDPVVRVGIIGGGIVALLLGIWITIILLFFKSGQSDADKVIDGEGWYAASDPDGLFTAYFPVGKAKYEKLTLKPPEFIAKDAGTSVENMVWKSQIWARKENGREYSITLFDIPAQGPMRDAAQRAVAASQAQPPGYAVIHDDFVQFGAYQAKRLCVGDAHHGKFSLLINTGPRQVLIIHLSGSETVRPADPKLKAFFENVTIHR
jgi:hypothetical protein